MSSEHPLLAEARAVIGTDYVLTRDVENYAVDWRRKFFGRPLAVLRPATTEQVAALVKACAAQRVAIVPQGGNTGMCGAAVPDDSGTQVVLSLARMNRIREVDAVNNTMTAEAGCVLQTIQQSAAQHDRLFPLSLGAEGSCQVGGNISTNAGGVQVLRYGNTRDLVLGLEVVLASGEVLDLLRGLRKDNTGYDLKQLFIGAEGTLGIITAAVLKLFPAPNASAVAFAAVDDAQRALDLLNLLRAELGDRFTAFELLSSATVERVLEHFPGCKRPLSGAHAWYLLIEARDSAAPGELAQRLQAALQKALERDVLRDVAIASSGAQAAQLWALREGVPEAQPVNIKHDISLPLSRIALFIDQSRRRLEARYPGVRLFVFGHLGDGNLHYNVAHPEATSDAERWQGETEEVNRIVHDAVVHHGGSISAEHGLGQLKRDEIAHFKSALEIEIMRSIKRTLDPQWLMNPGKLLAR